MTQLPSARRGNTQLPRRYLALFLPWLSAERVIRSGIAPPDAPFALVEKHNGALRIAALDPCAARLGLEPGLPLADARGRVPELGVLAFDLPADIAVLRHLVRLCRDYTPSVAPEPPQALMLDITGCAHLHGGEKMLSRALVARVSEQGFTVRAALAATPDAARVLARFGGDDVCLLPVEALRAEQDITLALSRAGFRTIGELAGLPRAPLAARFGEALVTQLERLLAHQDPHLTPDRASDPVCARKTFAEPIGRTEHMLQAIRELMGEAIEQLARRGEGGRAFAIRLHRSDGHVFSLAIGTGAPTRDPALLDRLLRERIESLADPLDPGFGFDSIDVKVKIADPLGEVQRSLHVATRKRPALGPLLDRLAVRHGQDAILRFAAGDSHVPERAGKLLSVYAKQSDAPWLTPEAGEPAMRPLLLFNPPQKVEVIAEVPDGPPRRFRWRDRMYRITRHEGPERIASEWWRRRNGYADNPGLTRDYYRVEDEAGHRFWLFRHGLYGRETANPHWYVHGLFA